MKKTRIRFFKFSDGKQNLQFHWPYGSKVTATFITIKQATKQLQNE